MFRQVVTMLAIKSTSSKSSGEVIANVAGNLNH